MQSKLADQSRCHAGEYQASDTTAYQYSLDMLFIVTLPLENPIHLS